MADDFTRDFTLDGYTVALDLAKVNYRFLRYSEIDFSSPFVLWRHDCDHSLNRALRTAEIERERGLRATYFINPHCNYYNLLEHEQSRIISKIIGMGHDIGLHFDCLFHDITSERQLDDLVAREAAWLEDWFGAKPVAFSFHSPTRYCLSCEGDSYGGLINCYAGMFKTKVAYCSDSNGYWRFRRLHDVLADAGDRYLQVLTHPEHWQDMPLFPRERVFRSIFGRAVATFARYDEVLGLHGRQNVAGPPSRLGFLRGLDPARHQLLDYLWNSRMFDSLFAELLMLHERQIHSLCAAMFRNVWRIADEEIEAFFSDDNRTLDAWKLFADVFGQSCANAANTTVDTVSEWRTLYVRLQHDRPEAPERLEAACLTLCDSIEALAIWGGEMPSLRQAGLGAAGLSVEEATAVLEDDSQRKGMGVMGRTWQDFVARASETGCF